MGEDEEVLYHNDRTHVSRQTAPDGSGSVVHKRAFGPGATRRIEHERAVLRQLAGVPGVPRLADRQARQALTLRDDGGRSPAVTVLPSTRLIEVARALANTVAAVHRAGVVHRDITPANLILTGSGPPILIDFDLALTGSASEADAAPPDEPVGTLGYLAPEQTGRIRLPVDRRSDLYGLGATLYALATGVAPFAGDDPLELIRDTLVRVPTFPGGLNPRLPHRFGEIVMRLLEKNPDRRYQSAEGLAYDLGRFDAAPAEPWRLGVHDFPTFLAAPSRLVGRDSEVRGLAAALDRAQTGGGPAVFVTGPPGIGKTALIQTLRPVVTARGGWFVTGKYDQFGSDMGGRAISRALRGLTRLLLAEPEPDVLGHRQRLGAALGPNAPVVAAVVPEMAVLLGIAPEPGNINPATGPGRISAAVVALLRAVAAHRPVVFVLDDLQWASGPSLRVLDAILEAGPIPGLLLLATYRDQEVDEGHPLSPLLARWERDGAVGPPRRLAGLAVEGLAELIGAILRMEPPTVSGLASLIADGSGGNPYETVELLNGLRSEGLLVLAEEGWNWDPDAVRVFVARQRVPQLLAARLDQQPEATRRLLATLACLGADVRPALLAIGAGMREPELVPHLAPAIADGLITTDRSGPTAGAVRFRHDLVQRAARQSLDAGARDRLRLAMARRLAGHRESRHEAAEQYLAVAGLLETPRERHVAATLLRTAGRNAAELTNYFVAEEFLAAAATLLEADGTDAAGRDAVAVDRHVVLHCLGRLDESDEVYRALADRSPDPITLATATCTQINSLAQRGKARAAADLGLEVLARFGVTLPRDLAADVERDTARLYRWAAGLRLPGDAGGALPGDETEETDDPRILVTGRLINRLLAPAFLLDPLLYSWLVLQAQRLWARHGVCAPLVGTLGAAPSVTIDQRDDYRTGYLLTRHIIAVGQARGYQAETALAGYMYVALAAHWFEPLEDVVEIAHQTRDELLAAGDIQVVCMTSARLMHILLDSAESLEACADELPPALAFATRTGNPYAALTFAGYQRLLSVLRGRTSGPGAFAGPDFDEAAYLADVAGNRLAAATYHVNRGIAAAIFDDVDALDTHSAAAMADPQAIRGCYVSALARLLRCLSLARRLRAAGGDPGLAGELTAARQWLARRAADAPGNYRHLLHLVDAERAWAQGDLAGAARDFDAGLHEVAGRPWHRALLAERAGRLQLEQGLVHAGRGLLTEARDGYRRWGADGKVAQLEAEHAFLRATAAAGPGRVSETGAHRIDLMAILRASQALSSQTTLAGLQEQVGDLLCAMTGATDVHVVLHRPDTAHWYVSALAGTGPRHQGAAAPMADPEAAEAADADTVNEDERRMPLSAVRYVLRTREPLLVADATRDDRFARDPYLAGLTTCALLVVPIPIPSRSSARAVLVLENRGQSGVFSTDRLETVQLLAGQLSVSIDNALLYDSLESTVRSRTADLATTNQRLADSERRLRSHFEHAAVGQVIHGTDDRIDEANGAFAAMCGVAPRDLGGTKLTDRFDPADRAAHRRELSAVIAGRQKLISSELVLLRADGRRLDVHVTVSAVRAPDGQPEHLVSIFQDISARRVAEIARDSANIELADRNRELETANRLKADLIGMLGHEISNPLAIILGYVDLALDDETAPAPVHDLIAKIGRNTSRLATIVQEVLALVSIDAGRLTAAPRPVRVAEHIQSALAVTAVSGVRLDCPPELLAAVQPGHLDHILTNLISNAAKYGGGATAIIAARTGRTVAIQVCDEGAGVPAEFRERLFDRFARADTTAGTVTGTGLGLYIVRELAGANGGDIRYRPAVPHGSIFTLTLPAVGAEAGTAAGTGPPVDAAPGRRSPATTP
ncbi:AAA family ATPase [Actinoplanes sp. NPDC049118]|uniref:AAA family ATPase n=1 Tax=Actinoplanes sp. NPDC049118 TaxID=3155769 RepID=UPI0033E75DA1